MFKQYTQCYVHTPGDKPFNEKDLAGFVAGTAAPGLIVALVSFLAGANVIGFVAIAITYAATITAVANQWLFHRLVCIESKDEPNPKCAIGVIEKVPEVGGFGEFDNDQFFDLRLMPHRHADGDSNDTHVQAHPANLVFESDFQGKPLISQKISDLPFAGLGSILHCEAEGNFWQAMKDYAALLGLLVGVGSALGAAGGAALGCAIGGLFGGIGCLIGAIIGAIIGALLGGGAAAGISGLIAFHSNPGDVEDANVGDEPLGELKAGDRVVVLGTHVYDGFHEGWHEFHPLMAIMRINNDDPNQYLEWNPEFVEGMVKPTGEDSLLDGVEAPTVEDMRVGLDSARFRRYCEWLRNRWCQAVLEAQSPILKTQQRQPLNRWTIHPAVDGCVPAEPPPDIR